MAWEVFNRETGRLEPLPFACPHCDNRFLEEEALIGHRYAEHYAEMFPEEQKGREA